MKKIMPISILLTMVVIPLLAWGGSMLVNHESRISKNETVNTRLLKMEKDIKEIHRAVHGY